MKNREIKLVVTEDGSHSLQVPSLNETYHSIHGAIQESAHVFIKNGLERWAENNPIKKLSIFEIGFGTGLNALLTLLKANKLNLNVTYQSIELYPLPSKITSQLNYAAQLGCELFIFEKLHNCSWENPIPINNQFTLAKTKASFKKFNTASTFDIIYFDAFAPSKQPEMWHLNILKKSYKMLKQNGVFVTYSAKGQLKRDLKHVGFTVETLPGPPGKFEMVCATKKKENY